MTKAALVIALGALCVIGSSSCATSGTNPSESTSPRIHTWDRSAIDTLLRMEREDQLDRGNETAIAASDTAVLFRMIRGDSVRSRWLQRAVAERGWPSKSSFGDSVSMAAWLILQHSPLNEWQNSMRAPLDSLAKAGEVRRSEVAMFTDRVLVHQKKPQIYGTQFDFAGGKLVASRIADVKGLDERRAAVGLPPMNEYVKKLAEVYRIPVVWPPES